MISFLKFREMFARINSGPICSVRISFTPFISCFSVMIARMDLTVSGLAASPMRSPLVSMASHMAVKPRTTPIETDATPSHQASPVTWARVMPMSAMNRPSMAALSSNTTTNRDGSLPSLTAPRYDFLPRALLNSFSAI